MRVQPRRRISGGQVDIVKVLGEFCVTACDSFIARLCFVIARCTVGQGQSAEFRLQTQRCSLKVIRFKRSGDFDECAQTKTISAENEFARTKTRRSSGSGTDGGVSYCEYDSYGRACGSVIAAQNASTWRLEGTLIE